MPEGLDRTRKMPSSPFWRRFSGVNWIGGHHRYCHRPRPHHHRPPHRRRVVFFLFYFFNLAEFLHRHRRLGLYTKLAGLAPPRGAEHGGPKRRRLRPLARSSEVPEAASAADVPGAGPEEGGHGDRAGAPEGGLALEQLGDPDAVAGEAGGGGRGGIGGGGGAAGAGALVGAVGAETGEALAEADVADSALPALGGVFQTFPHLLLVDVDRRHCWCRFSFLLLSSSCSNFQLSLFLSWSRLVWFSVFASVASLRLRFITGGVWLGETNLTMVRILTRASTSIGKPWWTWTPRFGLMESVEVLNGCLCIEKLKLPPLEGSIYGNAMLQFTRAVWEWM